MESLQSKERAPLLTHEITVAMREKGSLTGIEKVVASCETSLNLISKCGNLMIRGEKLKIIRFNADDGTLIFEGTVQSMQYGNRKSFLRRIFK